MSTIKNRICELEATLTNCKNDYENYEMAAMEEELFQLNHIVDLWSAFGDIPMNPDTEKIEEDWYGFKSGTNREDIWHWFEEQFEVSVGADLMGVF
jgi:hypothetical protein